MTDRHRGLDAADPRRLRDGLLIVQKRLDSVRSTAESDDGLITVTVGGRGELLDLVLDPRVYREPDSRRLAREIVATVRRAKEFAATKALALARSALAVDAR